MDEATLSRLWISYKYEGNSQAKEELVAHYAYIVRYLVSRVMIGLPPSVEEDELLGYATLGLLDAMERFDPERGIRFETFANMRIKGAVLDGMRANDWVSRFARSKIKHMERTFARLAQELSREPDDAEMCAALDLSPQEYNKLQQSASVSVVFSLDETVSYEDGEQRPLSSSLEDPNSSVDIRLMQEDEKNILAQAITKLSEREQQVVSLYYYEGLTLKEIGQVLGVTESRICQVHAKAILRLRAAMVQ